METTEKKEMVSLSADDLRAFVRIAQTALGAPERNCPESWHITSDVTRDRVYVYICKGDAVIGRGFAYVRTNRENTDAEMAQCFSYAAHQAFKNAQWLEEFGRREE